MSYNPSAKVPQKYHKGDPKCPVPSREWGVGALPLEKGGHVEFQVLGNSVRNPCPFTTGFGGFDTFKSRDPQANDPEIIKVDLSKLKDEGWTTFSLKSRELYTKKFAPFESARCSLQLRDLLKALSKF